MKQLKVKNEVEIYETDGGKCHTKELFLTVKNHWNRDEFIVLEYNKVEITILADELKKAIQNSTNTKII